MCIEESAIGSRLSSLRLDQDKGEYEEHPAVLRTTLTVPTQNLEPKRHTSEIPLFNSEWPRSSWQHKRVQEQDSAQSASTTGTVAGISSSHSLHTYTTGVIPQPPGLYPSRQQQPSMQPPTSASYYHPSYSSTTLLQPMMPMQNAYVPTMYQIPEYYPMCQPVIAFPVATMPYYQYNPQPRCQPVSGTYSSFTKLPSAVGQAMQVPETEEGTHPLVQKYEENGKDPKVLVGHIAKLSKSQTGSRFLQKEIEKGEPTFIAMVLHEVLEG